MADNFTAALMPQIQPIGINPHRMQRVDYSRVGSGDWDIFGKAVQGFQQGQQIAANQQALEQKKEEAAYRREEQRQKSIIQGAAEVYGLPADQQMALLERRAARLEQENIPNNDTLEAIELLKTDPDAFNQTVKQAVTYGYRVGYLKQPEGGGYTESKIPGYAFNKATGRLEVADQSVVDKEAKKQAEEENRRLLKEDLDAQKTTFERAKTLRGEYDKKSADFVKVRDAYARVEASVENPDAAGDLALIFNYMKMLDPGSTVREGEFATAEKAGGVDSTVINLYNRLRSGERLNENQRQMFQGRSKALLKAAETQNQKDRREILTLGKRYNLTEEDIFGNQEGTQRPKPENAVEPAPGMAEGTTGDGGKYVVQDGFWVPADSVPPPPPENNVGAAVGMQEGAKGMGPDGREYVVKNGYWVPVPKSTTQSQRRTQRNQRRTKKKPANIPQELWDEMTIDEKKAF